MYNVALVEKLGTEGIADVCLKFSDLCEHMSTYFKQRTFSAANGDDGVAWATVADFSLLLSVVSEHLGLSFADTTNPEAARFLNAARELDDEQLTRLDDLWKKLNVTSNFYQPSDEALSRFTFQDNGQPTTGENEEMQEGETDTANTEQAPTA